MQQGGNMENLYLLLLGADSFSIALWVKPEDEPWGWCYLDHEDSWWRSGDIKVSDDGARADVYRGSRHVAYVDLRNLRYGKPSSQESRDIVRWMPEGWECEDGADYQRFLNKAVVKNTMRREGSQIE